jgi:replicative DNA helicase
LGLASFRESSELEFGSDDAFILVPDLEDSDTVTLKHLKARHTEAKDLVLTFDRPRQRFAPLESKAKAPCPEQAGKVRSTLAALWNRTAPAPDDGEGDG